MTSIEQYKGCFLGLAMGDAFAAPFEGGPIERLLWRAIGHTSTGERRFTDDTQMAIDLTKSFLHNHRIDQDHLAQQFAQSYRWSRGYGPSTSNLLKRIKKGNCWREINKKKFKGGSFGNGAAMRAPILALCFPQDTLRLLESTIRSAEITHAHPLGIEGAKLIALVTQKALAKSPNETVLKEMLHLCESETFVDKTMYCQSALRQATLEPRTIRIHLGNGIAATDSCVTAIYFALKFRDLDFDIMLGQIIKLGGDTDTIGAMAGAIWGAFNGSQTLEPKISKLERGQDIISYAEQLFQHQSL
ncbi:MAG: ADP-ribosylglycohydrolase family protein [Pseudomonadales bacterium]|nr:ADP-ribosylglycohydrolase family protein [Pseudomonadales bacterium]